MHQTVLLDTVAVGIGVVGEPENAAGVTQLVRHRWPIQAARAGDENLQPDKDSLDDTPLTLG